MKNIVFIVDVKLQGSGRWAGTRSDPYKFSIAAWKEWCKNNNAELFVLNQEVLPHDHMPISWQRYFIFQLLEANEIEYDQILYVDADTIPHPNMPNIFDISERKFCFVHNEGSYDWVLRSIENYSKYFFNGYMIPWDYYFDSGVLLFNKNHKEFFNQIISFFDDNREQLLAAEKTWHVGTDQTPVNFLVHMNNIDYKVLDYQWNMVDMYRKELLQEDLPFTKAGWIYQYNSIPNNKEDALTYYWMEKTFNHLYKGITI